MAPLSNVGSGRAGSGQRGAKESLNAATAMGLPRRALRWLWTALLVSSVGVAHARAQVQDGFQCVVADPAVPGNVYDLSALVKNDDDYVVSLPIGSSGTATYRLQFCRTLVAPQSAACTTSNGPTAVCETYITAINGVGTAPTTLSVSAPGSLSLTYNLGTPPPRHHRHGREGSKVREARVSHAQTHSTRTSVMAFHARMPPGGNTFYTVLTIVCDASVTGNPQLTVTSTGKCVAPRAPPPPDEDHAYMLTRGVGHRVHDPRHIDPSASRQGPPTDAAWHLRPSQLRPYRPVSRFSFKLARGRRDPANPEHARASVT